MTLCCAAVCVGRSRVRPLEMASLCFAERWSPAGPVFQHQDHSVWSSTVHAGPCSFIVGFKSSREHKSSRRDSRRTTGGRKPVCTSPLFDRTPGCRRSWWSSGRRVLDSSSQVCSYTCDTGREDVFDQILCFIYLCYIYASMIEDWRFIWIYVLLTSPGHIWNIVSCSALRLTFVPSHIMQTNLLKLSTVKACSCLFTCCVHKQSVQSKNKELK